MASLVELCVSAVEDLPRQHDPASFDSGEARHTIDLSHRAIFRRLGGLRFDGVKHKLCPQDSDLHVTVLAWGPLRGFRSGVRAPLG